MGKYTNSLFYNILAYSLTIVVSLLAVLYVVTQVLAFFGVQLFA
jgi:hypothetical protein